VLRYKGFVAYKDGRRVELEAPLAVTMAWEEYAHRNGYPYEPEKAPRLTFVLVLLHAMSGVDEGFDVWKHTVEDFKLDPVEVPPTLAEVTGASA
jgi:hypothetical protein